MIILTNAITEISNFAKIIAKPLCKCHFHYAEFSLEMECQNVICYTFSNEVNLFFRLLFAILQFVVSALGLSICSVEKCNLME